MGNKAEVFHEVESRYGVEIDETESSDVDN
jgi:hypothetical protein